jgi:hypothetical protein
MVDNRETGSQDAQLEDLPEDIGRVLHEMAEALTALGNFVVSAAQMLGGANPVDADVRKVVEGASGQHKRAATALHQLQGLLMRRKPSRRAQ